MIEKLEQSAGNVLGYKVGGKVDKSDYEILVPEVEELIAQEGNINLLLDLTEFKSEKISAWGADLKFGKSTHKQISKLAIIGDKRWQKWLTKIADPFYAKDAEYFSSDDSDAAWAWLNE